MSVTLATQMDTCPSLYNPFAGTKNHTAQKAWDAFALHQCGVPTLSTVLVDAGSHQVKKTYHKCADWSHCAYVAYSLCPVVCVLPKYFHDPTSAWPDQPVALSAQSVPKQKKLNQTAPGPSLSTLCKQLLKKNKKKQS